MASERARQTTFAKLIDEGSLEIGDGYRAKNAELGGDGLIFLRAGHVTDTHIDFDGVDRFQRELESRVRSKLAKPGDAVVTTKGNSTGRTTFVTPSMPPFVYSPHLSYWRSKDLDRIEGGFLRYWSKGAEFSQQLAGMKASTDMAPYLSLVDQKRLNISLPPIQEQRAIAHILGTLDDKIELDRRMNETLEAMAQALFKSWFVDFDPVRAKAEGRDPRLPKHLADLFPDSFEDSQLGEIPTGWEVKTLSGICEKPQYGYTASASAEPVGPHFLRITDINKRDWIEWKRVPFCSIDPGRRQKYALRPGDIVIARMADPGHGALIEESVDAVFASYLIRFRPQRDEFGRYLQYWLRSDTYWGTVRAVQSGTTRANLNAKTLGSFGLVVPPSVVLQAFGRSAGACRQRVVCNVQESRSLAAIRDTLLPKLISGELRIDDRGRFLATIE